MNRPSRAAAVPAALVTIGLLLSGCGGSSDPEAGGTPTTATSSAPTPSDPSESEAAPDYTVIDPYLEYNVLDAGRYALAPVGPNAGPLAVLDVPGGYISSGPFLFPVGEGRHHVEGCCIVAYWTVGGVYKEPCTTTGGSPDPGPSVKDLARALIAQRLTTTTKPTPVRLDGYDGVYLELTGPAGLDLATCHGRSIAYWEADPGTRYISAPASAGVDRLWILDVDGERVVLDIGVAPDVDDKRIEELVAIAESAHFADAS